MADCGVLNPGVEPWTLWVFDETHLLLCLCQLSLLYFAKQSNATSFGTGNNKWQWWTDNNRHGWTHGTSRALFEGRHLLVIVLHSFIFTESQSWLPFDCNDLVMITAP